MKKSKIISIFFIITVFLHSASYATPFTDLDNATFHHVEDCTVCHDFTKFSDNNGSVNSYGIRDMILTPNSGYKKVVFRDSIYGDDNSTDHANGDAVYDGICEVCHTVNNHHRNDGSDNTAHMDGKRCTSCHLHVDEFAPPVRQAHRTHLDYRGKGPLIQDCAVCHEAPLDVDANYQYDPDVLYPIKFRDGLTLETTTACDNCHSPWGAYPGGDETTALMDPVIGAKANFRTGIYEADEYTLKDGKEKWCVTCHDNRPSTTHYDSPPESVAAPQTIDYRTSAFTFNPLGSWTDRALAAPVDHMRANAWNTAEGRSDWMTMDFNISVTGSYMLMTQWDVDNSTCNTLDGKKPLLISVTDANGTTLKYYEQRGYSPEFSEMATFDIVAGTAQLKVQKDAINCGFDIGAIKIEPQAGSGDQVVIAPMIAGDDKTWGFYATGHGVSGVQCTECHDPRKKHIDYDRRTHNMGSGRYNVVNPWGDSYRLQTKDPIAGASICGRCHDMELIWDRANKVAQTNYKNATTGNNNLHAYHMGVSDALTNGGDSDWDGIVDSDPRCLNCHNVHGSTKPHMFRDGNLVSSPYTSDKKPMFDHAYEVYVKATWKPILQGGSYEVFARWPAVAGAATNAPFTIKSTDIFSTTVVVDQTATPDTWISLGTYTFNDKNQSYVMLNDKYTNGTVIADAVQFVSVNETVIIDNGDSDYSTLEVNASLSGLTGYNGDYDAIAANTTTFDSATSPKDYNKPLLIEQSNLYIIGIDRAGILQNKICKNCHDTDGDKNVDHFTGPKILNRFEAKRWVMNDGTEDAEVYVTARDYDSNISSVTLDLTPIGGGVVAMSPVGKQLYHYTIPAWMISGLSDISYKLPVTAVDTDAQSVTDETYLFPKDGKDTIYLDTNNVALYNVHMFRFAVNTAGASWKRLPADTTYFGPGYRVEVANLGAGNYGVWTPEIPRSGKYEVYAFWPGLGGETTTSGVNFEAGTVKYTAHVADGTFEVIKDQTVDIGQWNYIGTYNFLDDGSNYIRQESNNSMAMAVDAMKFVRLNSPPIVRLRAQQFNESTRIILPDSTVTMYAQGKDYDDGDSITYTWSASDPGIVLRQVSYFENRYSFSTIGLTAGIYTITVTVTDSYGASTEVSLDLKVPVTTTLGVGDTDGDGIADNVEGFTDLDGDGIPNYLDNFFGENEIPDSAGKVLTTEGGYDISIGTTAIIVDSDDAVISAAELAASGDDGVNGMFTDANASYGGLFDFDIFGLSLPGQSVKVILPLQGVTIPVGATYQKYDSTTTSWALFVEDADNKIESAFSAGNCPAPGSVDYTSGLTAGDNCIQLTIQDGGPNDADGLANAQIKDPGAVFGDWDSEASDGGVVTYQSSSSGGGGIGAFGLYSLLVLGLFGVLARRRRGN